MEVAAEDLSGSVRQAIDALLGGEGVIEIGVGVGDGAVAVGDEALSVVDLIDQRRGACGEVFDEILRLIVDAPLREVADECWFSSWWRSRFQGL